MNIPRTIFTRFVRRPRRFKAGLFFVAVTATSATGTPSAISEVPRKEVSEAFRYAPVISGNKAPENEALSAQEETLTLDKIVVTRYNDSHQLEMLLGDQAKRIREESFSWKNGGTLLKKTGRTVTTELKLKFEPTHTGWDVINFSW
jgi:hypothetical protein